MCNLSNSASTSSAPGDVSGGAAGGSTSGTQTCCPDVAEFKKRTTRTDYFGFDDKTNMVASGSNPYWVPPTASKTAPASNTDRDGSVWLSVEKGKTTKCNLAFTNNLTCIRNCTYDVSGSHASVVNAAITANNARFDILGVSEGDVTIKVMCNGKPIGWVHVACWVRKTYSVAVCEVNQLIALPGGAAGPPQLQLPRPSKSVAEFQAFFDDAWRDAAVKVALTGVPVHYATTTEAHLSPGGDIWDANGNPEFNHVIGNFTTMTNATDRIHAAASAANPGYDKYLYLCVAPGNMSGRMVAGFANSLPGTYGFFFNQGTGSLSTACHEFGHLVGLRHMNDTAGAAQYAPHLRLPGSDTTNINALDQFNLMGYGSPRANRKRLRYHQWKSVQGR